MKILFPLISLLALTSCAEHSNGDATSSDTATAASVQTTPPAAAGPQLQFFSSNDSVMAVVDGAGCGYSAPDITGDSSLFAFAVDGVIQANGRLEVLKMVGEGSYTDSMGQSRWENTRYRLELRVQDDSVMAGGVSQHGELTVEEKATGGKTTLAIVGGCGC